MTSDHHTPPKRARQFLRWYCPENLFEEIEGDLLEAFQFHAKKEGLTAAKWRYTWDVIRFFNPTTFEKSRRLNRHSQHYGTNHLAMFKNYFKIALRNLWKQKVSSFINVTGLCIGLAGFFLIGLFVIDEWQYDRYHPEGDRVYRIYSERGGVGAGAMWATSSPALGPTLKEEFGEVEQSLRLYLIRQKTLFKKEEQSYLEENGFFAEPSIFNLFHLPFLYGDPKLALQEPNSIVLTERLAKKYFGKKNPIGQTLTVKKKEVTVTGVLKELPPHFHLQFDFLLPFEYLLNQVSKERIQSWVWQDFTNYIMVKPNTDVKQLSAKLPAFVEQHAHPETKKKGFHYYLHLQPLQEIHLHSAQLRNDVAVRGNYQYLVGLAVVGLFLLMIACINFITLTTARAVRRSKEVGIRKAAGALRSQLVVQFIGEAVLTVGIAMLLASQVVLFLLPYLNDFTGKELLFPLYTNPYLIPAMLGFAIFTGLVAGSYPAFILSGFRPALALKSTQLKLSGHVFWLRKGLVVIQFTLSTLLIISVLIIFRQVNFLNHTDMGFQKEQLLYFPMKGKMFRNLDMTKEEFVKIPGVTSASTCFGIPGDIVSGDGIIVPHREHKDLPARIFLIDHEYIETMGMEIIAGRDFSREIGTDAHEGFIINETAVKTLELGDSPDDAIDKPLEWDMWTDNDTIKKGRVIGVVKDFHYASLHEEIQTTVLHIYPDGYWKMALRINTADLPGTLAAIEQTWEQFETGYPIDYQFTDASFGAMYKEESKLSSLLRIFTLLAIFIACIGAFGLATYSTEQRRKEIGIRKVLGASVGGIVGLLSKDFLKLVCIAILVASPVAWYLMNQWLKDFAYRIDIQWWVFVLAGILALFIAFLTVSFQSISAALANPVKALRNE